MSLFKHGQNQAAQSAIFSSNSTLYEDNFAEYIDRKGFTLQDVGNLCERSPRTVRSWVVNNPPGWVYSYLNACAAKR